MASALPALAGLTITPGSTALIAGQSVNLTATGMGTGPGVLVDWQLEDAIEGVELVVLEHAEAQLRTSPAVPWSAGKAGIEERKGMEGKLMEFTPSFAHPGQGTLRVTCVTEAGYSFQRELGVAVR